MLKRLLLSILIGFLYHTAYAQTTNPLNHTFKASNGDTIHYLVYKKSTHKPLIVLLNGLGTMSYDWSPQFIQILSNYFTIYAIDYPGINSPHYHKHFTFKLLAMDLNELITQKLIQKKQAHQLNMLGWSLGSMVALTYIQQYPMLCSLYQDALVADTTIQIIAVNIAS